VRVYFNARTLQDVKTISRGNALIPSPALTVTIEEATQALGKPKAWLIDLARRDVIPSLRVGSRVYVNVQAVSAVIDRLAGTSTYSGGTFQPELAGQQ
jgi:hypothetical protein